MKKYYYIKSMIDIITSFVLLLIMWPLFILIGILIKIDSKGPVFFLQERLGRHGKVFKIYKFRTMVDGAIQMGTGLRTDKGDSRITKIGNFLRKSSLDELPQLINIVKGQMSFVGPRPPVPYHPRKYNEYSDEQKRRFLVKPGISGYAQVELRNSGTWDERIVFDVEYVNNKMSLFFDVYILFKSSVVVFKQENVYAPKSGRTQ